MKPHETHRTGQGVGGNPESEGSKGEPAGPSESEPSPARPQGRPASNPGKPCAAYGGRVCEAGMRAWSSQGDLGRPSTLPKPKTGSAAHGDVGGHSPTHDGDGAGPGASRVRWGQGVGWGHSSGDVPGNREQAKGPWSTKAGTEKTGEESRRGEAPACRAIQPVLYGRPSRRGAWATALPIRSSPSGDQTPRGNCHGGRGGSSTP